MAALSQNGSVRFEPRGRSRLIAKLRFRIEGRQMTKPLGSDHRFIAEIQRELGALQAQPRRRRELRRVEAEARATLRQTKARLAPELQQHGLTFHGFSLRTPRVHVEPAVSFEPTKKE